MTTIDRTERTRAPKIFGACLMLAGAGLYFVDIGDKGRNMHWFVFPALILMGLGALFATIGQRQR
jgi:hypothetical protein